MSRLFRIGRWIMSATLVCVALMPCPAYAQAWLKLDVPDSTRAAAVSALGNGYEAAWNALLVGALRNGSSSEGARLWALARSTAAVETDARGTHIAPDALRLATRWSAADRRRRVRAADRE